MKGKLRLLCLVIVAALMLSVLPVSASAEDNADAQHIRIGRAYDAPRTFTRYELSVSRVYNKSVYAYTSIPVSHNGVALSVDARLINGEVYASVRHLSEYFGFKVTYRSTDRTLNVRGNGLDMDVIDSSNVVWANSRVLFSMSPSVLMSNGRMYAPLSSLAKAFGIGYSFDVGIAQLSGAPSPLRNGASFYAEDAVYWLSRRISAERRGESLLGQIAVGSVVMNRVASSAYPGTIWGVIFDRKWGVQFSPILDGSIYNTPTATSIVAAKICLEGFNVNRDALFFLYPRASSSTWIPTTRDYLFSIGKHDFYA